MSNSVSTQYPRRWRKPKFLVGLRDIQSSGWSREILAGVTLAVLMIPLNIGYAEVAGLPPVVGLYAAIVPMVVYALFATSRNVIASPDAAIAALMGSLLASIVAPDDPHYLQLAYGLAILCGIFFFLFWLFRLGFLANFLSRAVLVGLITGLGIEVLVSQIRKIMGVTVEAEGFFLELFALIKAIPLANPYSIAVGLGSIAIIRVLKRVAPKLPGALVALIIMTVVVAVFNLDARGVSVLGEVPAGLPSLTIPRITFSEWMRLVPGALALVALTVAEGLLLARKYAQTYDYKIDGDQETFAYGAANLAAGLTGGFAVGASASRTAAMDDAGARSQWPSIVAAAVVTIVLLFFTDLLALLPKAALAGIVANAVLKLIEIGEMRELYHLRRSEFRISIVCLLGVLILGTLPGLTIAFLMTTVEMVRRAARPHTSVLKQDPGSSELGSTAEIEQQTTAPGIVIYRFGGPLFFANASLLRENLEAIVESHPGELHWIVLDAETINDIDTTGAETLGRIIEDLRQKKIGFAIARAHEPIPDLLERYELLEAIGEEQLYATNRQALAELSRDDRGESPEN